MAADQGRDGKGVPAMSPGPWEAVCLGSEGYAIMAPPQEGRPGRRRVARCGDTDWDQDKANAQVIAALPDLLGTLTALVMADYHLSIAPVEYSGDPQRRWDEAMREAQRLVSIFGRDLEPNGSSDGAT